MPRRLVGAIIAFVFALLAFVPATSLAAFVHLEEGSFGEFLEPGAMAVIDSSGDLLVIDTGLGTVTRLDEEGNEKPFPSLGTAVIDGKGDGACVGVSDACDLTPQNGFSFDRPNAAQVAVDGTGHPLTAGNIYVSDSFHRVVDVFSPDGKYLGQLSRAGTAGPEFGETCGVAVDPTGAILVGDFSGKVHKFVPSTNPPTNADFVGQTSSEAPCEVAAGIGSTAGSIFINRWRGSVFKYDALGVFQYELGESVAGLATNPSNGNVVVVSGDRALEYDASGASEAHLVSTITGGFDTGEGVAVAASGKIYVSDRETGRVFVFGPALPIERPTVSLAPAEPLSSTTVRLRGRLNPHGGETTFYFEYGTEDCSTTTSCESVPIAQDASAGSGTSLINVSRAVSGLQPQVTYYFRLVAGNEGGTSTTSSGTFVLPTGPLVTRCPNEAIREAGDGAHLGHCRAYELVSAIPEGIRNGVDVLESTQVVRAAVDGNAFKFSSISGTADAESVPFMSEYLAVHTAVGRWAVRSITPPQPGLALLDLFFGVVPRYVGSFAPNLDKAVFLAKGRINDEGANVSLANNLYLRSGLLDPGAGRFQLLSDAEEPQLADAEERPTVSAVSADLSHVLFETSRVLTNDAAGLGSGTKLYQWVSGDVRLVGILPASESAIPTLAQAGRGSADEKDTLRTMSEDGSRIAFTVPGGPDGRLYMRDDQGTLDEADDVSVQINATEKTNGGGPGGSDPNGPRPATFWSATANMSQLFFTTKEALTNDTPADESGTEKLYRYDVEAAAEHRLTLLSVDEQPAGGVSNHAAGVVAVSRDGSYVYFIGHNQLQAGGPSSSRPRIFVWHEDEVRAVAAVNPGAEENRLLGVGVIREDPRWARITPDGSKLVFVTEGEAELIGYSHGVSCPDLASSRCQEVYLYDAEADSLMCASCNLASDEAVADADFNIRGPNIFVPRDSYENRAISADGRFVFFDTAESLSPFDRNQEQDVYEFDSTSGEVQLISSGELGTSSHFMDASADGRDVFFATRAQLVGDDRDANIDIYDARVGGGLIAPSTSPTSCESELSCRPPAPRPSTGEVPASAALQSGSKPHKPKQAKKRKKRGSRCKSAHRKTRDRKQCKTRRFHSR